MPGVEFNKGQYQLGLPGLIDEFNELSKVLADSFANKSVPVPEKLTFSEVLGREGWKKPVASISETRDLLLMRLLVAVGVLFVVGYSVQQYIEQVSGLIAAEVESLVDRAKVGGGSYVRVERDDFNLCDEGIGLTFNWRSFASAPASLTVSLVGNGENGREALDSEALVLEEARGAGELELERNGYEGDELTVVVQAERYDQVETGEFELMADCEISG